MGIIIAVGLALIATLVAVFWKEFVVKAFKKLLSAIKRFLIYSLKIGIIGLYYLFRYLFYPYGWVMRQVYPFIFAFFI